MFPNIPLSNQGKVVNWGPEPGLIPPSFEGHHHCFCIFEWCQNDGMGLEWQGWKLEWPLGDLLIPSFLVQSSHSKAIPVIPVGWGHISLYAHSIWEWSQNEKYLILRSFLREMSLEWRIFRLQYFCHWMNRNDTRMTSEWWNDVRMIGLRFQWWNDIWKSFEWRNDIRMI